MDREKFTKLCEKVLRRTAGKSPTEVAVAIADAMELVLEMERPDLDTSQPIDLSAVMAEPVETPKPSSALPPSPAIQPEPKLAPPPPEVKLIFTPDEAKADAAALQRARVAPIKISRVEPAEEPGEDLGIEHWTVSTLVQELTSSAPETLEITPYGTEHVVILSRDILADHVLKAAKLIYTLSSMKVSQPWVVTATGQAATGSTEPPAMSIDLPVFRDFFTTDSDLKLPEKIDSIVEQARQVYAPRPREIHSATPLRNGPIRFDASCPHAEADVLTDQQGRSY